MIKGLKSKDKKSLYLNGEARWGGEIQRKRDYMIGVTNQENDSSSSILNELDGGNVVGWHRGQRGDYNSQGMR